MSKAFVSESEDASEASLDLHRDIDARGLILQNMTIFTRTARWHSILNAVSLETDCCIMYLAVSSFDVFSSTNLAQRDPPVIHGCIRWSNDVDFAVEMYYTMSWQLLSYNTDRQPLTMLEWTR